jgi:excisionase family DNA binding protein
MQTGYSGPGGNSPRYLCGRAQQLYAGEHKCQSIGGGRLEKTILEQVFTVLEPAALSATAAALAEADTHHRDRLGVFDKNVERARYEAERAARQYDNVEPENRLVARTLEAALEAKLAAVRAAENDLATQRARRPVSLTPEETAWITRAGADVRAVFDAPTTTVVERKQLIRAVIAEVVLTVDSGTRIADLRIIWQGGADTRLQMPMTKTGAHPVTTDEDTLDLLRRLAAQYDDTTVAQILSKQHRRTATGLTWTKTRVKTTRTSHGIAACQPEQQTVGARRQDEHMVTVEEAGQQLGVSKFTLYRWLREGFITGQQLTPGAPWRIRLDQEIRDRVRPQASEGWLSLDQAAKTLGLARQTVLHKVQRGELDAVHVTTGKRKGLRINVNAGQPGLFDNPR